MTLPDRLERFQRWREIVPWTNEEIAVVLDSFAAQCDLDGNEFLAARNRYQAAWVRSGNLSSNLLGKVLSHLIKTCAVCGKTALFRKGNYGFCRIHKHVTPIAVDIRREREEARSADKAKQQRSFDAVCKKRSSLRSAKAGVR